MGKKFSKSRRRPRSLPGHDRLGQNGETRAAEALTVGWTLTVTTVFLCDLASVAAQVYARNAAPQSKARLLGELLLFSAAVIGAGSLALLPIVYRARRCAPPHGVVVFGALVAIAPLVAVAWRVLT